MHSDTMSEPVKHLDRRRLLKGGIVSAAALLSGDLHAMLALAGGDWRFDPESPIIAAPDDPASWPAYREDLAKWREKAILDMGYDDALYRKPEFAWSASNYSCALLMMCDQAFYDPKSGAYRIESLIDDGALSFGGYDSVVLWHAYPRIGVDQRNQFDFYRDMPGGLAGIRETVRAFHRHGVRVYIDYNPWDKGTRREPKGDLDALAEIVGQLEVDGIFLDTLKEGASAFRDKLDRVRPGVVLEGELTPPLSRLPDHHASWAQWFKDSKAPGVLQLKWLERRHMQHQVSRWSRSHTAELQTAWMNGSGMMVWENVFGSWVPWNAHDRSLLRAMLPIQRRYTRLFQGRGWTPLVPVQTPGVYASLWQDGLVRLWTVVNRTDSTVDGVLLKVDAKAGDRYADLIAGGELKPVLDGQVVHLRARIPAHGVGCFLSAPATSFDHSFEMFLHAQAAIDRLADQDMTHPLLEVRLVQAPKLARVKGVPSGMVPVLAEGRGGMTISMRVRECGFYESEPEDEVGLRGSASFRTREFERPNPSMAYAIDETPVTNAAFALFLKASGYAPKHRENFLKHWPDAKPPIGKEDHPVVWVDLDDARAYAAWAGKRLPTEEEWQFAAQGPDGREYPWGSGLRAGVCNLGETGDTTPVRAYPQGASPFGCLDLCGNVWQWTESERNDGRNRFSILRGGSYFAALGSHWYVDGGPRAANFATKFLHMWPGLDRCATVGFRCVVDLES